MQKFRERSIVFKKPGIFCQNLKTLMSSNYPAIQYFCWNLAHVSYLPMTKKGCAGFFLFCLDLELFSKIKKTWFLHTPLLHVPITQDLNEIRKIQNTLLYTTHFSFLGLNILPSKNHAWTTGHVVRLIDHNLFIADNIDSELKVLIKWKVYQSKIWMMVFLMTTFQCWLMQKPFMCQSYIQNHIVV